MGALSLLMVTSPCHPRAHRPAERPAGQIWVMVSPHWDKS